MPIAFNPETGDALVLFDNEWVKPEKIAQNDKGEIAYLLNNEWVMPGQEPKPKEIEPETSTMGAIGRGVMRGALPSAAGIVAGGAGAMGTRAVRDLAAQLFDQFPKAEEIRGEHVSGAKEKAGG